MSGVKSHILGTDICHKFFFEGFPQSSCFHLAAGGGRWGGGGRGGVGAEICIGLQKHRNPKQTSTAKLL